MGSGFTRHAQRGRRGSSRRDWVELHAVLRRGGRGRSQGERVELHAVLRGGAGGSVENGSSVAPLSGMRHPLPSGGRTTSPAPLPLTRRAARCPLAPIRELASHPIRD